MRRSLLLIAMRRSLLLSVGLTVLMALLSAFALAPAFAADVNLRISIPGSDPYAFAESPRWIAIPGTRVYMIEGSARPTFDVFRHGSYVYAYRGGTWYRAKTWNGRYSAVEERYLPAQFNTIPRERWRAYPPGWEKKAKGKG